MLSDLHSMNPKYICLFCFSPIVNDVTHVAVNYGCTHTRARARVRAHARAHTHTHAHVHTRIFRNDSHQIILQLLLICMLPNAKFSLE